ncbi:hypothetical protein KGQ64_02170 [bacterium]|nr:hypothetical protein [bacterium]
MRNEGATGGPGRRLAGRPTTTRGSGLARTAAFLAAASMLAACASTTFRSTWVAPGQEPVSLAGKRVAAVFASDQESTRRVAEDALARDLTERGAIGVPGYTLLGTQEARDENVAREKLGAAGIDGFVLMRVVSQTRQATYVPGTWSPSPWGAWRASYSPGYLRTDTLVAVETLVYSLRREGVLWGGLSDTINPNRIDSFVTEVADAAVRDMAQRGLLAK